MYAPSDDVPGVVVLVAQRRVDALDFELSTLCERSKVRGGLAYIPIALGHFINSFKREMNLM